MTSILGPSTANYESGMEMPVTDSVVAQILAQAPSRQVAEAMLLGSSFEGGWGPTFAVGDYGTSFGPFQMHEGGALTSSGLTPAQAQDPQLAVKAMLASYEAATTAQGSLWQTNPMLAAEQAATAAERPAESYLSNYGAKTLSSHWADVQGALGSSVPGSASYSALSTPGQPASSAGTSAVLISRSFNPLGYAIDPIGSALGLGLSGGGGLDGIAKNLANLAKNIANFTAAILYGGTWIRFGEVVIGAVLGAAGLSLIVVTIASSPGGLSTIGTIAALVPLGAPKDTRDLRRRTA